ALGAPDAAQASLGIAFEIRRLAFVVADQSLREIAYVGGRQVQTLGTGGRHDVRSVTGQEQAAELHRLADEAAQRCDALLERWASDEVRRGVGRQARAQLGPERVVGPALDLVVERALHVVATARATAHAAQREA